MTMDDRELRVVYGGYPVDGSGPRELALASHGYIARDVRDVRQSYFYLGFHLYESQALRYYADFGFDSLAEYADANFGLDKGALSRCINVFKRFSLCQHGVHEMSLDDRYKDYSYSQLCEMVSMDDGQLREVEPSMTVKEIRELKKKVATSQLLDGQSEQLPERESKVATSQPLDPVPDPPGEGLVQEPVRQSELPPLKNDKQRKEWLESYEDWGLWYLDGHIGVKYYKYDFENGARLVVEVVHDELECGSFDGYYFHLVGGPKPPKVGPRWAWHGTYGRYVNSEAELLAFLKFLQKKR